MLVIDIIIMICENVLIIHVYYNSNYLIITQWNLQHANYQLTVIIMILDLHAVPFDLSSIWARIWHMTRDTYTGACVQNVVTVCFCSLQFFFIEIFVFSPITMGLSPK